MLWLPAGPGDLGEQPAEGGGNPMYIGGASRNSLDGQGTGWQEDTCPLALVRIPCQTGGTGRVWGVPQSSEGQLHEGQAPSALPGGGSLQGELHGFENCSLYCGWIYLFFFPLYFKQNKLSLCCLILALKFSELFQGMNPGCSHGAHKGQNWDKWCHIPRQSSPCALKPSRAIPERGKLNPSGTIPE